MIVSAKTDNVSVPRGRKQRNFKSVYRTVPGSDVVSAPAPQKPTWTISKHIAKPFIYDEHNAKCKMGYVPLKSNQLNSHVEGASLFNAPVYQVAASLDVPQPMPNTFSKQVAEMMYEDHDVHFTHGLDYNAGIRPSHVQRALMVQSIPEPTNPFPDRPAGPGAPRKVVKTTYDVGKLSLEALGRSVLVQ
jgi:hypothetical protein